MEKPQIAVIGAGLMGHGIAYLFAAMPLVRIWPDAVVGEFAHLVANRFERVIKTADADGRLSSTAHQLDEPGAMARRITLRDQLLDC